MRNAQYNRTHGFRKARCPQDCRSTYNEQPQMEQLSGFVEVLSWIKPFSTRLLVERLLQSFAAVLACAGVLGASSATTASA